MNTNKRFAISILASLAISTHISANADEIVEPTGLNQIHEIIDADVRLNNRVSPENMAIAHESVTAMNHLIKEAIKIFIGIHNFEFFHKKGSDKENLVREVYETSFYKHKNILLLKLLHRVQL